MQPDIKNIKDIETLINTFYSKIQSNEAIRGYFAHVDWEHHLPVMVGFWNFILFDVPGSYTRNVMNPHIELHKTIPFTAEAFDFWLKTFEETVKELFEGENAEKAIQSAKNIGLTMKYKLLGSQTNRNITISVQKG